MMKRGIGRWVFVAPRLLVFGMALLGSHVALADTPLPQGWFASGDNPQGYEMRVDRTVHRRGHASGTLKSIAMSIASHPGGFGTMMQEITAQKYQGKRVRLTGYIKAKNVEQYSGLWMRIDGSAPSATLNFDNMMDRPVKGTTDWTKCEIVLDVPKDSRAISFGVMVVGKGQAWADDLRLEAVGPDNAPTKERTPGEAVQKAIEEAKMRDPEQYARAEEYMKKRSPHLPPRPVNLDFEMNASKASSPVKP